MSVPKANPGHSIFAWAWFESGHANDAPWGSLFPSRWTDAANPFGAVIRALRDFLERHPLLKGLLLEIRSLVHRIEIQRKARFVEFGFDLEKTADGVYQPNKRTHACMRDTEHFLARYPWMSVADGQVFQHAWELGAEWALNSERNQTLREDKASVIPASASREGA
jgi:hypothetical protein